MNKRAPKTLPFILIRVLPPAILLLAAIWLVAAKAAEMAVETELSDRLNRQGSDSGQSVSHHLNNLRDAVRGLAANDLVVNGLFDVEKREAYLPTFVRSLKIPGPEGAHITIVDYRGRTIVANGPPGNFTEAPWLARAMNGEETFRISERGVLLAVPINYNSMPEGVLVVQFNAEQVPHLLELSSPRGEIAVVKDQAQVLFTSEPELTWFEDRILNTAGEALIGVEAQVPGFPGLSVISAEPEATAFASVRSLHLFMLIAVALDLLALTLGIFLAAYLVTKPIGRLVGEVRRIRREDDLRRKIDLGGPWEICALANAFNAANADLSQAIQERERLEQERTQAVKMESLGTLAGGIAHEINTPVQYVGDNIRFLENAFADVQTALKKYEALAAALQAGSETGPALDEARAAADEADLDYLAEEIPTATSQSLEGISRVGEIVQAIKEFSYPDSKEKSAVDINNAIATTLTVTRNQWKYTADLEQDFDERLPLIPCFPGELNQVILNLIVNAAHAIAETGRQDKGKISVQTSRAGDVVEIRISDNGTGIPTEIRDMIFDPFFTTKEPGEGTGQGLAICHSIITKKHGGTLCFDTEVGQGTTFTIRLPIEDAGQENMEAA